MSYSTQQIIWHISGVNPEETTLQLYHWIIKAAQRINKLFQQTDKKCARTCFIQQILMEVIIIIITVLKGPILHMNVSVLITRRTTLPVKTDNF